MLLRTRPGSLLIEALIAIVIFAIFLGGIGIALVLGERSTIVAGDRSRAAFIAEQQLEAVRQMRATDFASVTTGNHGLALGPAGWSFSGTLVQDNGYASWVTVTSKGTDWIEVASHVTWNFGNTRSGAIVLNTQLTDWRKAATVGNWEAMTRISNQTISSSPEFQSIATNGTYAYVTSDNASGGKGLYVFDISNPASPVSVSSAFDLGASAYGLAAYGDRLYLATNSATQEVQVYDISNPAALTTGNLVNSYDLPGDGRARSIVVYGSRIFIGATYDALNDQFYAVEMSETGPMTFLDSISLSGSVLGIALHDGYAYAATTYNVGEFQVVDIFDPESLTFAPGAGIDMADVHDGNAIATTGTSALIGRVNGSTIDELTLYDVGLSPVPSPPPGPWTLEIDGDVRALATIFGSEYAFVGGTASNAQIRVIDLVKFAQGQAPVIRTYDAAATIRGIAYDWLTDRMFAVSASNLMVFAPG